MTATSFELRLLSPGSRRGALQRLVVVPLAHTLRAARLNRLFTVTLFLAAAVRLLTGLGFQSALWFYGDSFTYVASATDPHPDTGRPVGYSFILWALKPLHSLAVVTTLQHVAGLGIAILTYAVVRRYGVSARLATLAAAPVLFDAYQIQLEHMILGDVWFTLLLTAAVALMLWHPGQKPSVRVTALAGLLLGFAAVLRTIGLPIVALLILWMLLRRVGWRALAAAAVAAVLPVVTYMGWYASHHGQFAMSYATGPFLWARTSVFADCAKFDPPPNQQWLCPLGHPETRSSSSRYFWSKDAPIAHSQRTYPLFSARTDALASDFAKRAIRAQPWDYTRAVIDGIGKSFTWSRSDYPEPDVTDQYLFPAAQPPHALSPREKVVQHQLIRVGRVYEGAPAETRIVEPFAGIMRGYQSQVFLRGPFLAGLLAVGAAGVVAARRRRGGAVLLPLAVGAALLAVPPITVDFDYRYVLPSLPFVAMAAALAAGERRRTSIPAPAKATPESPLTSVASPAVRPRQRAYGGQHQPDPVGSSLSHTHGHEAFETP